jgi:predicted hotdog family 3-hydroxylacyl-ACP dehydratase
MNIEDINIKDLIPQREPIIMVGKLIEVDIESATTTFYICDDNLFVNDGFFSETGMIENIAQTSAAMNGYIALMNNSKVKIGYIGLIKNLTISNLPKSNTTIVTTVKLDSKVLNVDIIKGCIKQNDIIIAECEMRVFLNEN